MKQEHTDQTLAVPGAYHLEGAFLKGNGEYKIRVEITAINTKPPENPVLDEFNLRTVT